MSENTLIPVEAQEKVTTMVEYAASIKEIVIKTNGEAEAASEQLKIVSGHIRDTEAERKRIKEPYLQRGKEIDAWFKPKDAALKNAKHNLDVALRKFQIMLEDKRRKEQEELNRRAEEERRKKEEAERREREKAEAYRQQGREDMAAKAEMRAEARAMEAETTVAPVAQVIEPKLATHTRANWKCEITDPIQFVNWIAKDPTRYHLLQPNQTACNAWAKSIRREEVFPGGRIFNDEKMY